MEDRSELPEFKTFDEETEILTFAPTQAEDADEFTMFLEKRNGIG